MANDAGEEWTDVDPKELIFRHFEDGEVVIAGTRGSAMFGAIVRNGKKRVAPLVILFGSIIADKAKHGDYRRNGDPARV